MSRGTTPDLSASRDADLVEYGMGKPSIRYSIASNGRTRRVLTHGKHVRARGSKTMFGKFGSPRFQLPGVSVKASDAYSSLRSLFHMQLLDVIIARVSLLSIRNCRIFHVT